MFRHCGCPGQDRAHHIVRDPARARPAAGANDALPGIRSGNRGLGAIGPIEYRARWVPTPATRAAGPHGGELSQPIVVEGASGLPARLQWIGTQTGEEA